MFFLLVFALSAPIYIASPFVHVPGLPKNMPILDLVGAFMPLVAASILTYREEGGAGVKRLLRRAVDYTRITRKTWFLPVLLLTPAISLATLGITRLIGWEFQAQPRLALSMMLLAVIAFLVAAAGEELGWMGYAIDPMQQRWSALTSAVLLGLVWWAWHVPSIIQSGQPPVSIAWGLVASVGVRILAVWLYNNTGKSVCAIILFHAMANVSSSFIPSVPTAAGGPLTAIAAIAVVALWGARTLSRYRFAARPD
ncbi:MAG: CPBP family intramembrane metalloprotease [Nocardiopsaceae bacterium]|nr:CPBP family intramembrane metalloprotease [Nocardiopsaceae bacterium]